MSKIESITARQINNSRGEPAVEVVLKTQDDEFIDSVPTGTSVGQFEAKTVPVSQAIENINLIIAPKLAGLNPVEQTKIDGLLRELDGTQDKANLGANAILPVSLACARAGAASQKLQLFQWLANLSGIPVGQPQPLMVMLCGGEHGLKNVLNIQEFSVIATQNEGEKVWQAIRDYLNKESIPWQIGPEGALAPKMIDDNKALELLDRFRDSMPLGLDVAASHRKNVVDLVNWIDKYPLKIIEDPFDQEAWPIWQKFTADFGQRLLVAGDDLFVTNPKRVERGLAEKSANAVVIKPNQIGTLSEVFEVARLAHKDGWTIIVSHRSGETMDDFIADLAMAVGAKYLKAGAPSAPERKVKYDRLEKIIGKS